MLNFKTLSSEARQAIDATLATKGPYKGRIARKAPRATTLAYAARQALLMRINPFKVSIGGIMFMDEQQKLIYAEITKWLTTQPDRELNALDKDRSELETLGVW